MTEPAVAMVREAWHRIETWCGQRFPALLEALNPGASEEEIASLETTIGQPLPADVRESFAIHNGENPEHIGRFLFGMEFFPLDECREHWDEWTELQTYNDEFRVVMSSHPEGAIQLDYANDGWVPLAQAGSAFLGIDLAPGPTGSPGQVINYGRDEEEKCVFAKNWGVWLLSYANFLEQVDLEQIDSDEEIWGERLILALGGEYPLNFLVRSTNAGTWPLPRRTTTIDPSWRTPTVMGLAQSIAEEGDAERMPILGDALQDAGCDDREIIEHCQICGPSVLGCWVISAVLDSE